MTIKRNPVDVRQAWLATWLALSFNAVVFGPAWLAWTVFIVGGFAAFRWGEVGKLF